MLCPEISAEDCSLIEFCPFLALIYADPNKSLSVISVKCCLIKLWLKDKLKRLTFKCTLHFEHMWDTDLNQAPIPDLIIS